MSLDLYDDDASQPQAPQSVRPHIGIYFECCGVYARIYRTPDSSEYSGRCPKCLATVRARVGRDGTTQRIFRAK
jgi:hypothetical protein